MPANKKYRSFNVGGTWFHEHPDGSVNATPRTEEEELETVSKRGSGLSGSGVLGTPEEQKSVLDYRKRNEQDLIRSIPVSLLGSAPASLARNSGPIVKLAAQLTGLGTGAMASSKVAELQGREDVNPLGESAIDRVLDIGTQGAMNKVAQLGSVVHAGFNAPPGQAASTYMSGLRNMLPDLSPTSLATKLVVNKGKMTDQGREQFLSAMRSADELGLPAPAILGIEGGPTQYLGVNAINKLKNAVQGQYKTLFDQTVTDKNVRDQTFFESTKDFKTNFLNRKRAFKAEERAAHESFDSHVDANKIVVPVTKQVPSGAINHQGNPIMMNETKDVEIAGPVDVTKTLQWADKLGSELQDRQKSGNLNSDAAGMVGDMLGMVRLLQNAPEVNGRKIANYNDVKALRGAIAHFTKEFPSTDTKKRQMVGAAKTLTSSLSDDSRMSISDPTLWKPDAALAYAEANALTQRNARAFNSKRSRRLEGVQDSGDSIHGKDYDIDDESEMLNALKSRTGMETYMRMAGPDAAESLSSMFIKNGFDKAMDPKTGLYDPGRLEQYFKGDIKNNSIFESNLMSSDQRRVVKDFINYSKRLSSITGDASNSATWRNNKIMGGAITFGMGAGGLALAGAPMPMAAKVGGAIAITLHLGREFAERVLLDPEGGKLVQAMIHASTTQKKYISQNKLIDFGIKNGIKTTFTYLGQDGEEKTKTIN